ncbi:hypothetical protein [Paraflavitalea speifideaquila]|uniref:hypothetical protein n=1 Tax=Paraflavitalea speifideaquila TaxID=3076558 RepID=UPI0028E75D8A|nr:hypothetical protein [Paraflavitalea speifideiaquila]
MEAAGDVFEIIFNDKPILVRELPGSGRPLFLIPVQEGKPLVITTATGADGAVFWTSIPEGRQALAQSIGKLIEAHFRKTN